MSSEVHVDFFPPATAIRGEAGELAVVVDILRATTTIIMALDQGAEAIFPVLEVETAFELAAKMSPRPLLGGERGGVRIEGFDLGNSPSEYSNSQVRGRRVVFTTTNGTRALLACEKVPTVLLGAFVNISAVVGRIVQIQPRMVRIVCAGTDEQFTAEDGLFAGLLTCRLVEAWERPLILRDSAQFAMHAARHWLGPKPTGPEIARIFSCTLGGANLRRLGMSADFAHPAAIDSHPTIAVWTKEGGIRKA